MACQDRADLRRIGGAGFEYWFAPALPEGAGIVLDGFPAVRLDPWPVGGWRPDQGAPLALFVDEALPEAGRDAGADAALSHIAALGRLGFRVRVAARASVAGLLAAEAGRVRLAYLHRLASMGWAPAVRAANPGVRVIHGLADLHFLRARRRRAIDGTPEPENLAVAEIAAARSADVVITHSAAEADILAAAGVLAQVVPWEVRPAAREERRRRGGGVSFLGHFGHAPNEDAARWLLDTVMPLVWRARADAVVAVAGRAMPDWLRARAGARVRLCEEVADLAALWTPTALAVAPLRYGAGLKGKVLAACAAGVACLCTPVAAEGFPAGLVPVAAAEPDAFADALLRLLAAPRRLREYGRRGRDHVATACTSRHVDQALASAVGIAGPGLLSA